MLHHMGHDYDCKPQFLVEAEDQFDYCLLYTSKRTGRPIGAVLTLLIALACVLTVLMIIESRRPAEIEIPETPDVTHFVVVCTLSADAGSTRSMSSVSYTHLDVYKRQHSNGPSRMRLSTRRWRNQ